VKWTGVLLNSNHDALDGRYSPQPADFAYFDREFDEDFDETEPLPDMELEGD